MYGIIFKFRTIKTDEKFLRGLNNTIKETSQSSICLLQGVGTEYPVFKQLLSHVFCNGSKLSLSS